MKVLSAAEMRETDRLTSEKFGVPSFRLMQNAGAAVARFVLANYPNAKAIGVICGKGNNGGDGFIAAAELRRAGKHVRVLLLADPKELKGDSARVFRVLRMKPLIADKAKLLSTAAAKRCFESDVLVDAILGTGFKPPVAEPHATAIRMMNESGRPIVAVDVPSGIQADAQSTAGSTFVKANATVTFTAPKPALVLNPEVVGSLLTAEIGAPTETVCSQLQLEVITPKDFADVLRSRPADSNKGSFGHVLVIAGSQGKSGAAAMAGVAALRVGSGLVTVATPKSIQAQVAGYAAELMTFPLEETSAGTVSARALEGKNWEQLLTGKTVVALGPGLTTNTETVEFVRDFVARCPLPMVLDADGLNAFAGAAELLSKSGRKLVLTPHPGEMARLISMKTHDVQSDRVGVARRFAKQTGTILVLKGFGTLVALPEGKVWVNPTGNPAMAKGGMGDVLTGMIAGMLAQNSESISSIWAAVYLHGLLGDLAREQQEEHTVLATDLFSALPLAFKTARHWARERPQRIR